MRIALVLLMLCARLAAQETAPTNLWEQLEHARDATSVAAVARAVDGFVKAHPKDQEARALRGRLAEAWHKVKQYDEALRILDSLLLDAKGQMRTLTLIAKGRVHESIDQIDKALELYQEAAAAPSRELKRSIMDEDTTGNIAYRSIARCREKQRDWKGAFEAWNKWLPESGCGNELVGDYHTRDVGMARCLFHLGDRDTAVDILKHIVQEVGCINGDHPGIALIYAEHAAKSGRLADARAVIAALPAGRRNKYEQPLHIVEAWSRKDAKRMVALAPRENPYLDSAVLKETARLIGELGPDGDAALLDAIAAGDRTALTLAWLSGRTTLIAPLEKRRRMATDAWTLIDIDEALEQLRPPESRPVSRPSR